MDKYKNYEVIRRDGYVVVRVVTYPRDLEYGIKKVVHYLPSTILPKEDHKV